MSLPADLSRPLRRTAARIRVQRAASAAAIGLLVGVGLAGVVVALTKTAALDEVKALSWLYACAALPILAALAGALRPVRPLLAAKLLDRAAGLHDRVTNAVSFAALAERTAFMDAAIGDARAHASRLDPRRAMPLRVPFEVVPALGIGAGVALLALVEVPRFVAERATTAGIVPLVLHADDLDAFDSGLRELLDDPETPDEVRDAARELNRLIEDLADQRLDRAEALRRIAELEQRLSQTRPADAELLRDSLAQLGRDLDRASLADELSRALQDGDAERAEAEMRRLAERLRTERPNRAELERLRRALQRAAENRPEDRTEELRQREDELSRLLRRQREQEHTTEQERRLLQRRQRELERLRREHQQAMERRRQLERLQRELERAAEELSRDRRDQAADRLESGAEDLNRMARQQLSEEEMRRLQEQLAELRELIRRSRQQAQGGQRGREREGQGQGGQSRMDRFVLRARGQGEGEGIPIGVPGQGGRQGGQPQGQGQGQGQRGQGGEQRMLVLGGEGGNALLEIPGMGERPGEGPQGSGPPREGPGAGIGHDPTMLDDPTRLGGTRRTVRVEGQDNQGPTRSEVILSSAQRGFATRHYRDVYADYSDHAEEVLERDEIPPGYRFYVRRYFQLIRPREAE
ncbi:MAG TPA: hypothetical protein VIL20_13455 [Sandaracinaceae bacterium]